MLVSPFHAALGNAHRYLLCTAWFWSYLYRGGMLRRFSGCLLEYARTVPANCQCHLLFGEKYVLLNTFVLERPVG
jgi:hypothetical protein